MSFQSSKKRNTKVSPVPSKYSGPVKNGYTSVHAKLATLRSSFKPQGGWHVGRSLIDSHMRAHKQRVESAKACVDTATPKAMAESTKGKRVWVDGTLRSSTATGRTGQPLQSRNPGKVVQFREHLDSSLPSTPEGDAERTDSSGISPGSEPKAEGISTGAKNLSEATVPKVQNTYVTRTARLTAAYKERRGSRQCARGCQVASTRSSPLPWRPGYPEQDQFKHYRGFSVSSLKGIDRDNLFTPKKQSTHRTAAKVGTTSACSPSTQQTKSSPSERRSPSTNERSQCFAAKDFNRTFLVEGAVSANGDTPAEERNTAAPGAMPAEPGSDSSGTPYIEDFEDESGADEDLDSNSSNQSEEDSPPDPMHAVEPTSNQHALVCPTDTVNGGVVTSDMTASDATTVDVTNSDVTSSDMMTNGVMTNDVRFTVSSPAVTGAGSVPVRRESDYLAFIARVTQDVLAKGVYTDAGLKLLFEEHTERNRELLDINEMKKRIQHLTESLSIS